MFRKVSLVMLLVLCGALPLQARLNLFEPWHPGNDMSVGEKDSYEYMGSVLIGERYWELPFALSYSISDKMEAGFTIGILSLDYNSETKIGISDLLIGMKYSLLKPSGQKPAVIGEVAVSLPTADHTKGLGTGSVGLFLHWALEKNVGKILGSFGLGYTTYGKKDGIKYPNTFSYHFGGKYDYNSKTALYAELKGFNRGNSEINGQELYFAPGIDYKFKKYPLSGAILIGMSKEANDLGVLISTRF